MPELLKIDKKLQNKVAVITGGSRGIGREIAILFAKHGAHVVINYMKNDEAANKTKEEIERFGQQVYKIKASVSDRYAVQKMMDETYTKFGKIDILINNAGVLKVGYFAGMTSKEWREIIDVNLNSLYYCTKPVLHYMIQRKQGKIINVCSFSGIAGLFNDGHAVYSASKAGAVGFTKALAKEIAHLGISVSAIAPGLVDTEMLQPLPQKLKDRYLEKIPLKRIGHPNEIAQIALFLASSESSYIQGEIIISDGGWLA